MKTNTIARTVIVICGALVIAAVASGVHQIVSFGENKDQNADQYTVGDAVIEDTVRNLDIDWTSGNISFEYHDKDTVEISETSRKSLSEDKKMRWWLDDDTLRIRFGQEKGSFFSFGFHQNKALTVKLPENIALGDVTIDSASGDVQIPKLQTEKLTLDLVSGDLKLDLSEADLVRISSVSGDVEATLDKVRSTEITTTTGDVKLSAPGLESLDIDVTTGDVTAALSEKPGFTARLDTVTGKIAYDLPLTEEGGAYVCGDGSGSVKIDTTTGGIRLTSAEESDK